MSYTAINIQGNILSSEILEKIRGEDIRFQTAKDFGLGPKTTVREEINDAWRLALSHWGYLNKSRLRCLTQIPVLPKPVIIG